MWRATLIVAVDDGVGIISIHALRVEGDSRLGRLRTCYLYFNPRPPCGGRPHAPEPSAVRYVISIHALRVEGDSPRSASPSPTPYFNPRPPCGGRPADVRCLDFVIRFQSTPSVWRATSNLSGSSQPMLFQSTPSVWRATSGAADSTGCRAHFNPRPPCGGRRLI